MSVIIRESTPHEINKMKQNKQISFTETALFDGMERESGEIIIRQVHIGRFIVDGLLKNHKLVIEYDGHFHNTEEKMIKDEARDRFLNKCGFLVIRYQWFQFINDREEFKVALNCLIQTAVRDMNSLANFPTTQSIPVRNLL